MKTLKLSRNNWAEREEFEEDVSVEVEEEAKGEKMTMTMTMADESSGSEEEEDETFFLPRQPSLKNDAGPEAVGERFCLEGFEDLCKSVGKSDTITTLELSGCSLNTSEEDKLYQPIRKMVQIFTHNDYMINLTNLDLSDNNLGGNDAQLLIGAFGHFGKFDSITDLNLSNNIMFFEKQQCAKAFSGLKSR